MARADLIKKLFSGYCNDDRELFIKTAKEIIDDERKKNHSILADDLEMILSKNINSHNRISKSSMKTVTFQTTEKDIQLVELIYPDKYMEDIVLSDDKRLQLDKIIKEFLNWDVLVCNGVSPTSRLLFYGPPGCGKTLCAHVIAAEIGIPLMYVRFDALVSSYLGETASNIRKVFDLAKDNSFVLFFDEFDAIGRSRSDEAEHGEIKRVVNTFLQQIDNFKGHSIVIAATNYEKSLDYALWRRFDDTICFELPSNKDKIRLFKLRLKQFNGPTHCFDGLVNLTNGFSHSDIENICKSIMRKCILEGKRIYSKKDIEYAVKKQEELVSLRKSQYNI